MTVRMSWLSAVVGACVVIAAASPASAAAAPRRDTANHRVAPRARWPGSTSSNWSGYALDAGAGTKFTSASGMWRVPTVQRRKGYSASWVGIDGAANSSLIQTGTEQDYLGKGRYADFAWWEILPAPPTIIPDLVVIDGDRISASVKNVSANLWVISIADLTSGQSFSIKKTYTGPGASAEWIEEAPSDGSGVLKLARYSETNFSKLQVGTNLGRAGKATLRFPGDAIAMVQNGKQVSTPSKPKGNSFNVAYGNQQPAAP